VRDHHFLRIFRMGLGRDSVAGLCLLKEGVLTCGGTLVGPDDIDILVFTDPGAEWPLTYDVWPHVKEICDELEIRAVVQEKPSLDEQAAWLEALAPVRQAMWEAKMREDNEDYWHQRTKLRTFKPPWTQIDTEGLSIEDKSHEGFYHRRVAIFDDYESKESLIRFSDGGCTENHKVLPNRRLMGDLCEETFNVTNLWWGSQVRAGELEPHQVMLFIAADESRRVVNDMGHPPYYEMSVYPFVEMGIKKSDEEAILKRHGLNWVHKSGCVGCKYQGVEFFWALSQIAPWWFERIERYEATAADRNPNMVIFPKMKGKPRIAEAVARWRRDNPTADPMRILARDYQRRDAIGGPCRRECG
jgi:hypothetical protein